MKELPGTIGVRRPDDVHREFEELVHREQIHVERHLGGGVGARRLDRLIFLGRVLDRAVHFRGADLNKAFQPIALHEFFGKARERHRVGLEEAPRVLPRHRAFALRGEIYDDLRLLAVEQFEQEVEFVGDVISVILVARPLLDIQRERFGTHQIAANPHHQFRIGAIEQIQRGMNSERSAAAQYRVSLAHQKFLPDLRPKSYSIIVQS